MMPPLAHVLRLLWGAATYFVLAYLFVVVCLAEFEELAKARARGEEWHLRSIYRGLTMLVEFVIVLVAYLLARIGW